MYATARNRSRITNAALSAELGAALFSREVEPMSLAFLVGGIPTPLTILVNYVNWDDYFQYNSIYGKIKNVPGHQPDL